MRAALFVALYVSDRRVRCIFRGLWPQVIITDSSPCGWRLLCSPVIRN